MTNFEEIYELLKPKINSLSINEPLFKFTTLRVGGPAALYSQADNLKELKLIIDICHENKIDYFIIGRGANLLISDKGFNGFVIHLGKDFNHIKVNEEQAQITAGSAVSLAQLIQKAYSSSFEGLAFAAGIPATLGGAISSNAGAHGSSVCDLLLEYKTLSLKGLNTFHKPFDVSYRKGPVEKGEVVVEATLQFLKGNKMEIMAKSEANFSKRKQTQPLNLPNAGSVFKNPSKTQTSGSLIEECSLKGRKIGGAMISEVHANFIVNKDNAKASDIYKLIKLVQSEVKNRFNVELETEIKLVGDFDE